MDSTRNDPTDGPTDISDSIGYSCSTEVLSDKSDEKCEKMKKIENLKIAQNEFFSKKNFFFLRRSGETPKIIQHVR